MPPGLAPRDPPAAPVPHLAEPGVCVTGDVTGKTRGPRRHQPCMTQTEHATDSASIVPAADGYEYADLARLMSLMTGDEKHGPAATSTLDALWVLYDRVLNVDPRQPGADDRDRFLLSKGHGPAAYYAVLAAKGFLDAALLPGFGGFGSPLGYHPDRRLLPGVAISSGAAGLDNLHAIVVDNASSTYGWPGGIADRFGQERWSALTVDGHDHAALERALTVAHPGRPHVVIATVEPKD